MSDTFSLNTDCVETSYTVFIKSPLFYPKEQRDEIATMETINNGKSVFEARLDVDTSWQCLEYYAGLAASMAGKPGPGFTPQVTRRQKS